MIDEPSDAEEGFGGLSPEAAASPRRVARLGAIQALYQIDITAMTPDAVLLEFLQHRLEEDLEGLSLSALDRQMFSDLVRGVIEQAETLDDMLSALLPEEWPIDRLERLLKMILRAGAFELVTWHEIPARAVISEYVDLAHAFFTGKEPGMANGILDRIARILRPEEFDGSDDALTRMAGAV